MATKPRGPRPQRDVFRYGIGEWFGESFATMPAARKHELASHVALPKKQRPPILCPFQSYGGRSIKCNKAGGVCSIREYINNAASGLIEISQRTTGLRTICPQRFL